MKLLYYTDQIYKHGGLERVIANKVNYFSNNTDIELHVMTFQQKGKIPCYDICEKVQLHDISIDYDRLKSFFHPSNLKKSVTHFKRLKKAIDKIRPDVIVVCNYEFGFYFMPFLSKNAILIKEYHSSRHFVDISRNANKNLLKSLYYKFNDYFEKKYTFLVLLTKDESKYYSSKNQVIIPNSVGVIKNEISTLKNKRAVAAGRIAPVKGFEYMIRAWKEVHLCFPDWQLDIYGSSEDVYIKELQDLIDEIGLRNVVSFKGSTSKLGEEMLSSSIYVMTSLAECFPMVLLEAMQFGLPVVSFDCPNGPRNIIEHDKDGILSPYLDEKALSESIKSLIRDPEKRYRISKAAKIKIQNFSNKEIMLKWLSLFGYEGKIDATSTE